MRCIYQPATFSQNPDKKKQKQIAKETIAGAAAAAA